VLEHLATSERFGAPAGQAPMGAVEDGGDRSNVPSIVARELFDPGEPSFLLTVGAIAIGAGAVTLARRRRRDALA
jgi:hypothetical protein